MMQNALNRDRQYNPKIHVISGAIAGGLAAAVTTPLDVCKTLINTQEKQVLIASKQRYISGLYDAMITVYCCCSLKGFFQGIQARVLYSMPATAISWSVYEFLKYIMHGRHTRRYDNTTTASSAASSSNLNLNLSLPKIPVS